MGRRTLSEMSNGGKMTQEKLFMTDEVKGETIQKFDNTGAVVPEPKKPWEIKQEEFEKEWKYGSTSVFVKDGMWRFVGDTDHCPEEDIFYNALKMRRHMAGRGLKYGHMNYNDPPTYEGTFDYKIFVKDQPIYKWDIYGWDANDKPILITPYVGKITEDIRKEIFEIISEPTGADPDSTIDTGIAECEECEEDEDE